MIIRLGQHQPKIDWATSFIAHNSTIIGQVELGPQCSVWYNAVIRGDTDRIEIGAETNVQDGAVIHTDPGIPMVIGSQVTIGHKAMLHGCQIGNGALIGINAVALNGSRIGANTIVGANTLIPEGKEVPPGVLVVGSPFKIVRELTELELSRLKMSARVYTEKIKLYRTESATIEHLGC